MFIILHSTFVTHDGDNFSLFGQDGSFHNEERAIKFCKELEKQNPETAYWVIESKILDQYEWKLEQDDK